LKPTESRLSFQIIPSPLWLASSLALLVLLAYLVVDDSVRNEMGSGVRLLSLLPLILLCGLMVLDGIQRVIIENEGIRVISLAALLFSRFSPLRRLQRGRNFRLTWARVDAVELRIPHFQSPLRRTVPKGWLLAGSSGRLVKIPLGHPQLPKALAILKRFVHPYFLQLPSRDWEGKIPPRLALEKMLRSVVLNPETPPAFLAETARACLLWGIHSQAERLMDLAVASSPRDVALLEEYYQVMKRLGNHKKAEGAMEKLMALRSSPMDLLEMAELRHADGDQKGATEYLLQAAEQPPSSDLAHFLLGCIYVQREGLEMTALDQWRKGLDRARHPQLLGKLGDAYRYHRALLTTPGFFEREQRRMRTLLWSQRLGLSGTALVLAGLAWWWLEPGSASPFPGRSGGLLILGGLFMIVALFLRRPKRDPR
jgi:tetratricopeptide (TPR) repeat protein